MNDEYTAKHGKPEAVLIDTWWNVNFVYIRTESDVDKVLIDTWWNVNCMLDAIMSLAVSVLIDTWWNVNNAALINATSVVAF